MHLIESPVQSSSFSQRKQKLDTLVLHYTALDLESSLRVLRFRDVSCHYVVAPDGAVHRLLREDQVGWHAGLSAWAGKTGVNGRSVGIEIVNLDGNSSNYPEAQLAAVVELCGEILQRNPAITARNVVGHSDVAPKRKVDPGKRFPWQRLAAAGIGIWPEADGGAGPATNAQVQVLLERCGYAPPHAYGVRGGGYVFVDPAASPAGIQNTVQVTTRDLLRAFQLHYRAGDTSGVADVETLSRLRSLARRYDALHL